MPIVRTDILKGQDSSKRNALAASITDAMVQHLGCPPESVTIILNEVEKEHWYIGGQDCATKFPNL
jgi:4-oxalocrotonate tautomerase